MTKVVYLMAGRYNVINDIGTVVGEIYKRKHTNKWGVSINGVYWSINEDKSESHNNRGGMPSADCDTLARAKELAVMLVEHYGFQEKKSRYTVLKELGIAHVKAKIGWHPVFAGRELGSLETLYYRDGYDLALRAEAMKVNV